MTDKPRVLFLCTHNSARSQMAEGMLAEIIGEDEAHRTSVEEAMKEHRVVFVVHSEEVAKTLGSFAQEGDRLVRMIPSTRGSYAKEMGIKGSWLVFEKSE
jgi:predicted protein tyrosine phosphatase